MASGNSVCVSFCLRDFMSRLSLTALIPSAIHTRRRCFTRIPSCYQTSVFCRTYRISPKNSHERTQSVVMRLRKRHRRKQPIVTSWCSWWFSIYSLEGREIRSVNILARRTASQGLSTLPPFRVDVWCNTRSIVMRHFLASTCREILINLIRVRRQNIWGRWRRRLAEHRPRLGVDIRRRACGAASADVRSSGV